MSGSESQKEVKSLVRDTLERLSSRVANGDH